MGLEARLLQKAGYEAAVAINLHPALLQWVDELKADNISTFDFDPPPFMEQWWWWRKTYLSKAGIFEGIQDILWRVARRTNKYLASSRSKKFFQQNHFDLNHIFLPWTDFGGTRLWLSHYSRVPAVLSVRNAFRPTTWKGWVAAHYREAFMAVRGIYAISQSALDHFMKVFGDYVQPKTVTDVIHNSVDTRRFKPDKHLRASARGLLDVPQNAVVIGAAARLERQKRPDKLVSVYKELKMTFPDLYLVLVGTGSMEAGLREQVRQLGIRDSVVFAGWQPNVERILPALDMAVHLSSNEGFGTATVEAMACGLPVVATEVPGTRDILAGGNSGILVPVDDMKATVEACKLVLSSEALRRQLGLNGRRESVARFDEGCWRDRILGFYQSVFDGLENRRCRG
jgi:glycosyltransferase involved in cell wall biosynthesis